MEAIPGGSFSYVKNDLNSTKLVMLEFLFYFLNMIRILHFPHFNIFLFRDFFLTWIMESSRITVMDSRVKKWNKVSLYTVLKKEWVQFPKMRIFFLCHKIHACCQVWLWHLHHGKKVMEHLVGYQWSQAMGHVGQRKGIDRAGYGSQTLGSLGLYPLAPTAIFKLARSPWLVCSSSHCLCMVRPQFWTWCSDRTVKVPLDEIPSLKKIPCSSWCLQGCNLLGLLPTNRNLHFCFVGFLGKPVDASSVSFLWGLFILGDVSPLSVTERWDYPLLKAVGKKLF